jgi:hypothetical protein
VRIVDAIDRARRLDDDEDALLIDDDHCAALAIHVDSLASRARRLDPTSRSQLRDVRNGARSVAKEAHASFDTPLAEAARSLVGYIEACGLSGRLDSEVVDIHVGAMMNLTNPARRREQRDQDVIAGLHKVVARRSAAADAPHFTAMPPSRPKPALSFAVPGL